MEVPVQIHIGEKPCESRFEGITTPQYEWWFDKPYGGMWTSSRKYGYGCDWLRFLHNQSYSHNSLFREDAWEVVPTDDARIWTITNHEDYELLALCYPSPAVEGYVDWEAVRKDFDIVYVEDWPNMKAYDCESTIWLNWSAVKEVRKASDGVREQHQQVCEFVRQVA